MAIEIEDDVFFADLSKQIALLIMDDDEEEFPVENPPVQFQYQLPEAIMPPPYSYEMSYRRESKGTGVFIPRSSSRPRRKNRSGKSTSISNSSERQSDKPEVTASYTRNDDQLYSNYNTNSGMLKNCA